MNTRLEKLLAVEDLFSIEGRGVVVMPTIPIAQYRDLETRMFVLLRKPDGTESRALAQFTMPSVPHPKDMCFACLLPGAKKEDIPLGTEIYRFLESEKTA